MSNNSHKGRCFLVKQTRNITSNPKFSRALSFICQHGCAASSSQPALALSVSSRKQGIPLRNGGGGGATARSRMRLGSLTILAAELQPGGMHTQSGRGCSSQCMSRSRWAEGGEGMGGEGRGWEGSRNGRGQGQTSSVTYCGATKHKEG